MTCAITTSILGCFVTLYLFFRYTWGVELTLPSKGILLAVFILMGCIPLFVGFGFENFLGAAYPLYRTTLYFIYIGCVILFTVTLLFDALFLIMSYTPLISHLKAVCCWQNYANLGLALIFTTYALYAGTKTPEIKVTEIYSDKIQKEQTIVLLSDLHIDRTISARKIREIVEKTNAENPDVIILAGDVFDDDFDKTRELSNLLRGLKAKDGVYFVTGNHEFYVDYAKSVAELKSLGFIFLENSGQETASGLYLGGIPDSFSAASHNMAIDVKKAFENSQAKQYRILVSHTPENFADEAEFDLEVSGHTHGGQIFPFHIFAKLHNCYLSGLYDLDDKSKIYVSKGAGQWGPQMRFLAGSEISVLKLIPEGKEMKKSPMNTIFKQGEPNPYGQFFTGQTYLNMLSVKDNVWNAPVADVTFEPGARTNWHKHSGGQILLVISGEGRYQEKGGEPRILHPGDVVRIPLNVEHWHGAAPNSWFSHVSIETNGADNQVTWLDAVSDNEYK